MSRPRRSTRHKSVSPTSVARTALRVLLGGALVFAGISHLTRKRDEFQAQVPRWVPLAPDTVVLASGVVEIGLGSALVLAKKRRGLVGWAAAAFFTAIFPGNISQYRTRTSAFGLDTDRKRAVRLLFQPVLVAWALFAASGSDATDAGSRTSRRR